jgi:hypothetical protein
VESTTVYGSWNPFLPKNYLTFFLATLNCLRSGVAESDMLTVPDFCHTRDSERNGVGLVPLIQYSRVAGPI